MVSFSGVTRKSGLRGSQLPDLARYLGMTDCACMDGGGSVYFLANGSIKLNTTRSVVADIILYYREKQASNIPGNTEDSTDKGTSRMVICTAEKKLNIREQPVSGEVIATVGKNEFIEIRNRRKKRKMEIMTILEQFMMPIVLGGCYTAGAVLKSTEKYPDKFISITMFVIVGILAPFITGDWSAQIVLTGSISVWTLIGLNQTLKQLGKDE